MSNQAKKAERFRALHRGKKALVLPNAWDVPSARVFEEAGFPAVATSSAGIMVSLGYPDGEKMPLRELAAAVGRIASRLSLPLSADIVSGYGTTPRAVVSTVRRMLENGAIGINLEDMDHSGHGLCPDALQVQKIEAIRRLGESMHVPLVINARTDALRQAPGSERARLREAIRRSVAYRDAGADCVYPMGLTDADSIATFVDALRCPVNVMIRKGLPPVATLEKLGVKRVSFGPSASYAAFGLLQRASREVLTRGTYRFLLDGAITFDELNQLAVARHPGKASQG
ncbi:MAG TPA: isocitrate lyase/phosphoenolpyruvate mutase family protein [Thermoplasmata archaeon]|nr:isocitrate lyase/phosphoenolpyruvate mutase family protein [Thermoplasmata archaeon]